jgi:hypothetical protein
MYACMYVLTVHKYIHTYVSASHIYKHTHTDNICTHIRVYVRIWVHVLFVCVCIYVCVCVRARILIFVFIRSPSHVLLYESLWNDLVLKFNVKIHRIYITIFHTDYTGLLGKKSATFPTFPVLWRSLAIGCFHSLYCDLRVKGTTVLGRFAGKGTVQASCRKDSKTSVCADGNIPRAHPEYLLHAGHTTWAKLLGGSMCLETCYVHYTSLWMQANATGRDLYSTGVHTSTLLIRQKSDNIS